MRKEEVKGERNRELGGWVRLKKGERGSDDEAASKSEGQGASRPVLDVVLPLYVHGQPVHVELVVVPEGAHADARAPGGEYVEAALAIAEPELRQVAREVDPLVVPDEVPVYDRVLLDEPVFGKARVALLAQHVLELLAQDQGIEVGHADGFRQLPGLLQETRHQGVVPVGVAVLAPAGTKVSRVQGPAFKMPPPPPTHILTPSLMLPNDITYSP
jgi:hypothetical protein